MSQFNQSNQRVDRQLNAAGNIVNNTINNHIPSPLETVKAAWSTAAQWFRNMLPETRRNYHNIVQFDVEHNRAMERIAQERLELAEADSSQRAYAENRFIQLKEEEKQLNEERFEWEKAVAQENIRLIRDSHASVLEMSQKKLQAETDKCLKLEVGRDDIVEILSQEDGKFVVIPSPPKVLRDDLQAFKSLEAEIPYKLKRIIEKYYGGGTDEIIGCKSIFEHPIGENSASIVGKLIAPIPTLILRSQVVYQHVYIWITITCPVIEPIVSQDQDSEQQFYIDTHHQKDFPLPGWNWMSLKKELEAQGQDCDTSSQTILELISTIHLIVTLYFCDLYCLNLNPSHSPKLFVFLAEPSFPDGLRKWTEPLQNLLVEAQKQIEEELSEIYTPEMTEPQQFRSGDYTDLSDLLSIPAVVSVVLLFLLVMCSQQSPNVPRVSADSQNPTENSQSPQAVATRIEVPISTGFDATNLRSAPKFGDEFIIGQVRTGESVTAYEISPDGQWRRIRLPDGRAGWVASNMVR